MAKDVRVLTDFTRHRKSKKLARLLDDERAWSWVLELWLWTREYRPEGSLHGMEHEDIADAIGWKGDPGQIVDALISSEYLECAPEADLNDRSTTVQLKLVNWPERQPFALNDEGRSESASRNRYIGLIRGKRKWRKKMEKWSRNQLRDYYSRGCTEADLNDRSTTVNDPVERTVNDPLTPAPAPAPAPTPTPTPTQRAKSKTLDDSETEPIKPKKKKHRKKPTPKDPGHSRCVAVYFEGFQFVTESKPAFGAKEGKLLKDLIKKTSAEQVERHLGNYFAHHQAGSFGADALDFATSFVPHFNRWATPPKPGARDGRKGSPYPDLDESAHDVWEQVSQMDDKYFDKEDPHGE